MATGLELAMAGCPNGSWHRMYDSEFIGSTPDQISPLGGSIKKNPQVGTPNGHPKPGSDHSSFVSQAAQGWAQLLRGIFQRLIREKNLHMEVSDNGFLIDRCAPFTAKSSIQGASSGKLKRGLGRIAERTCVGLHFR